MAERTRRQAKSRQRGGAKEGSKATEPVEQLDEATESNSTGGKSNAMAAAKRAAGAAAAAALAGALAGAGKALLQRRSQADDRSDTDEAPEGEGPDEPTQSAAQPLEDDESAEADEAEPAEQQPESSVTDDRDEDDEVTDASESEPEDESPATPVDSEDESEPERDDGRSRRRQPERGAPSSDVAKIIGNARNYVQDFLGKEPESVSGVDRSNGSWSVTVEVVELERVPDTTDVLGSYEVMLDKDGNLVRLERTRRYLRSQVEELT